MSQQMPFDAAGPVGENYRMQPDLIKQTAYREALEWQVTLWSGEVTLAEQHAFKHWLQAATAHQQAWDALQQAQTPFNAVSGDIASRVLRAPQAGINRRKMLLGIAAVAGSCLIGYGVRQTPQWQIATAGYRTGKGEHRTVTLPDGSEVMLNTASALDVVFTASQRMLRLHHGEILVTTAPDNSPQAHQHPRPFIIETHAGEVRPIGTRFSVRKRDDAGQNIQVQVFAGAVQLLPLQGQHVRLNAGQQACFNQQHVTRPEKTTLNDSAWTRGLLIAERQRLADFIAELARYRSGILRCDPAVAELIVSGVYPLKDTDAVLQSLAQALPVRISSITGYWVTVTTS